MKTCTKCGETKSLDAFCNDKSRRDGKANRCRSCAKAAHAEWTARDPERAATMYRGYGAQHRRAQGRKTWEELSTERAARRAAFEIPTQKVCERCGQLKDMQAFRERNFKKKLDGRANTCRECYLSDNREWYHDHKEELMLRVPYRVGREEELNAKSREYKKKNPEKSALYKRRRRAAKLGAKEFHTNEEVEALWRAQGGVCANPYCYKLITTKTRHLDHIMPLAKGGSDGIRNLQFLCAPCNQQKSAKTPDEWWAWLARKHAPKVA